MDKPYHECKKNKHYSPYFKNTKLSLIRNCIGSCKVQLFLSKSSGVKAIISIIIVLSIQSYLLFFSFLQVRTDLVFFQNRKLRTIGQNFAPFFVCIFSKSSFFLHFVFLRFVFSFPPYWSKICNLIFFDFFKVLFMFNVLILCKLHVSHELIKEARDLQCLASTSRERITNHGHVPYRLCLLCGEFNLI